MQKIPTDTDFIRKAVKVDLPNLTNNLKSNNMKTKLLIITLGICGIANAQWSTNPAVNNAICTDGGLQFTPVIASDGAGGAILAWQDMRAASGYIPKIFAQRIDVNGVIKWVTDGISICTSAGGQGTPQISADGSGGAYIAFSDSRSGNDDIYMQRIDSNGNVLWAAGGVAVCVLPYNQNTPQLITETGGGVITAWQDSSNGAASYLVALYAQKLNSSGAVQWTANGIQVTNTAYGTSWLNIVSDTAGGAIFCWQDQRNVVNSHDIYAQRLNSSGAVQWTANGVAISNPAQAQGSPNMISDGLGGAIIVWNDFRNGTSTYDDIYAQKINASGAVQWAGNGVAISATTNGQTNPQLCSDGAGGAIITWEETTPAADIDVYAQRVNSSGSNVWSTDTAICKAANYQMLPKIVSDKSGGAVIMWQDWRNGSSNYDVYAQRINGGGTVQWTLGGIAVSSAANNQSIVASVIPPMISDSCMTIMTWQDARNATSDIYAQKILCNGTLGSGTSIDELAAGNSFTFYPNPFSTQTTLHTDNFLNNATLTVYNSFGQIVAQLRNINGQTITFDRNNVASGLYFIHLTEGARVMTTQKLLIID